MRKLLFVILFLGHLLLTPSVYAVGLLPKCREIISQIYYSGVSKYTRHYNVLNIDNKEIIGKIQFLKNGGTKGGAFKLLFRDTGSWRFISTLTASATFPDLASNSKDFTTQYFEFELSPSLLYVVMRTTSLGEANKIVSNFDSEEMRVSRHYVMTTEGLEDDDSYHTFVIEFVVNPVAINSKEKLIEMNRAFIRFLEFYGSKLDIKFYIKEEKK